MFVMIPLIRFVIVGTRIVTICELARPLGRGRQIGDPADLSMK